MTTTTTFNLNQTIRDVIAEGVGPDPRDIATKVLELVPIGLERDLLAYLLPQHCRLIMIQPRAAAQRAMRRTSGELEGKWRMVRETILTDPYEVDGTWKLFGDLTVEDVLWLAEDRKRRGAELNAESERHSQLAAVMKRRKVSTVRELPLEQIEKVMS